MSARHDWRINPQEPSLEPVETGDDFAAQEAAENGIPDAEELHDDVGMGWQPESEVSGELAADTLQVRQWIEQAPTIYESGARGFAYLAEKKHALAALDRIIAIAARPALIAEKGLGDDIEIIRQGLSRLDDLGEWNDNLDDAAEAVARICALLAHEAPKEPQP